MFTYKTKIHTNADAIEVLNNVVSINNMLTRF